jgi:hypothetical protein
VIRVEELGLEMGIENVVVLGFEMRCIKWDESI